MNSQRVKQLNQSTYLQGGIVYWMSRDQRVKDNWALIYAQELAKKFNAPLSVVFCLRKTFSHATERLIDFLFGGLGELEADLRELGIGFSILLGDPVDELSRYVKKDQIGAIVTDFSPLRHARNWKDELAKNIKIPMYEVDAHNIVPVWIASDKQEFGAYTLRPKIHRQLMNFLEEYPHLHPQAGVQLPEKTDWKQVCSQIKIDTSVKAVDWIQPGEKAAHKALKDFLADRLVNYETDRNDPTKLAQSDLSPYIHFGQISTARIALEVNKQKSHSASQAAFLEELVVRKELSDNFCFYNPYYDSTKGFPDWAKKTLTEHANDTREFDYDLAELEAAKTHDPLWNAAQKEMMVRGKMHGYMRMYWAKKIFEWSKDVQTAQRHAIYLNDKYFLDGRDPNGYTGIAWSMGGVHDRAWFERPIFGKIRYMNFNGAKNKFDIQQYIDMIDAI